MGNVRNRLVLLLTVVIGVAAAGSYAVFGEASWVSQPLVMGAVFLAIWLLAVLSVVALTLSPDARVQQLAEALRAISIKQPAARLDAVRFGRLENIAVACNELAAALSEGSDPNLGAVKRRARPGSEKPSLKRQETIATDEEGREIVEHSKHPELGAVKKIKRKPPEPKTPPAEQIYEAPSFDAVTVPTATTNSATHDTVVDPSVASSPADSSTVVDGEVNGSEIDTDDEIRTLFEKYRTALAQTGALDELDFGEFKTTIEAEKNALIEAHGCKAIRFEVRVNDDDVSLLPHLVR